MIISKSIYQNSYDKAEFYEKIVSVKLSVFVIIVCKRYPSTYWSMQGSCFICINFKKLSFFTPKLESQPLSV